MTAKRVGRCFYESGRSRIDGLLIGAMVLLLCGPLPPLAAEVAEKETAHTKMKPRYTMPAGRGWAVCESYVRTLNATPANEGPPLCDLKLDRVPGMTRPDAEELAIAEHLPLIHQIELILGVGHIDPAPAKDFAAWREQFERRTSGGQKPRLRRFEGALVPGGPSEVVLIYDVDVMRCSGQVERKAPGFLVGSLPFLFDPVRNKVLPMNLVGFDHRPQEVRFYKGRLHAFEVFVGSDLVQSTQKIVVAGWVYAHRFQFAGKMADGPDPDNNSYGNHELCRIQFDYPFPR